jgi:enamine deaminase RidA (YjgF/YER057c/UK114 family)
MQTPSNENTRLSDTPRASAESEPAAGSPKEIIRHHVGARLSESAVYAGMVPESGETDIQGQTRDVLAQIDRHLQEAGSDKTRLLRVEIFLANIADIGAMNVVWDQWVSAGSAPPRATVEAKLANPAYKIEVVATAAVKA